MLNHLIIMSLSYYGYLISIKTFDYIIPNKREKMIWAAGIKLKLGAKAIMEYNNV